MEHRIAGDLVMGKLNKSMRKTMARSKSKKKKGSHKSDGSARSRKSVANSDLQVPSGSTSATGPNKLLSVLLAWTPPPCLQRSFHLELLALSCTPVSWQDVMDSWWSSNFFQGTRWLQLLAPRYVSSSHVVNPCISMCHKECVKLHASLCTCATSNRHYTGVALCVGSLCRVLLMCSSMWRTNTRSMSSGSETPGSGGRWPVCSPPRRCSSLPLSWWSSISTRRWSGLSGGAGCFSSRVCCIQLL